MRLSMLALATTVLVAGTATAATTGGSFQVTASVANSCVVTSTSNIAFGAYDPANTNFATALDGNGSVSVRCTKGTPATVTLDQGGNATAGSTCAAPARQMASGTDRLGYAVYRDAARTQAWGCAAGNGQGFTSTTSSSPTVLTTYGRIPAGQDVPAGSYTDTVNVTVTF